MARITEIEDYFRRGCGRCPRFDTAACATRTWAAGLAALRALCCDAGLEEAVRWGHPCYRHAGRNIAVIGAFRRDFRLSFFEAGLLRDPEGLLQPSGPNTPQPDMIRFGAAEDVARLGPAIRALLTEAMAHAAAGRRAPKPARDLEWPEELTLALDADPDLAAAFHALTPGRQRSYLIHLGGAKTSGTRVARLKRARPKILAGKGATER